MKKPTVSRRSFLQATAGSAAAAFLIGCQDATDSTTSEMAEAVAFKDIPLGVQLFCFRHLLEEDTPGTLAQIAGLGYTNVEFAGYYGHTGPEMRKMMDDSGLKAIGSHTGIDLLLGDELQKSIDLHGILGNDYLIIPGIGEDRTGTKDALLKTCEEINEIAAALKPHGMKTGYHCHAYSFQKEYDGMNVWQLIAENTTDDVIMQLDVGNAANGGADIPQVIKDTPGRVMSMHIKPFSPSAADPNDPFVGDDELPWDEIFHLSENGGGITRYVIEYEQEAHPPMQALKQHLENVTDIRSKGYAA